jgi:hypothetical protein
MKEQCQQLFRHHNKILSFKNIPAVRATPKTLKVALKLSISDLRVLLVLYHSKMQLRTEVEDQSSETIFNCNKESVGVVI